MLIVVIIDLILATYVIVLTGVELENVFLSVMENVVLVKLLFVVIVDDEEKRHGFHQTFLVNSMILKYLVVDEELVKLCVDFLFALVIGRVFENDQIDVRCRNLVDSCHIFDEFLFFHF